MGIAYLCCLISLKRTSCDTVTACFIEEKGPHVLWEWTKRALLTFVCGATWASFPYVIQSKIFAKSFKTHTIGCKISIILIFFDAVPKIKPCKFYYVSKKKYYKPFCLGQFAALGIYNGQIR